MLSVLRSGALQGIEAMPVAVEVDIAFGLPGFSLVGLPDSAVKEARERVFSSLKNSGFEVPSRRITINLAPADLRKEGSALDLPMALGMLAASEQIEASLLDGVMVLGELSLDGGLRPARGILSLALAARRQGLHSVLLPAANAREAALVPGIRLLPAASLKGALEALRTGQGEPIPEETEGDLSGADPDLDYTEIKGHTQAKRALEVAAAGGHNFLMAGSPGCGKTLMARRLPSILPPLSDEEGLEATRIYSVAGLLRPGHGILRRRPFRAPHHSISDQALVGGGKIPRPGEVSLAHLGVLFLDELPEFRKSTLETLRQPLEDGHVTIARTAHTVTYPSRCLLGAALNPCPCGFLSDPMDRCTCRPDAIARYRGRISGPLLDRIDLHLEVPSLGVEEVIADRWEESSESIRARVLAARAVQHERFRDQAGVHCNAHMATREIRRHCTLTPGCKGLLRGAVESLGLSARAFDRILKVARTVADLDGCEALAERHIAEAIHYRSMDRRLGKEKGG
ncbi:MAG TPA: YifB family Mg chelatase-like AAA ATPase [Fibrobacteria bacterium]|nr:YifB family Mg chelatase-like AAA ATPase [Fibrobacteria bacterium]